MPRVISGKAKGTQLKTLDGENTRPTADRTKEAMFSVLGSAVYDARVLDLCAGSGQLGIEALSRGAAGTCFVDQSNKAMQVVRANVDRCHMEAEAEMLVLELGKALRLLAERDGKFDLIFFDPPYKDSNAFMERYGALIGNLLEDDGTLVLEEASLHFSPTDIPALNLRKRCKYGAAMVSFYNK